ncbi:hypothetical protein D3C77_447570 [compost metagenome]
MPLDAFTGPTSTVEPRINQPSLEAALVVTLASTAVPLMMTPLTVGAAVISGILSGAAPMANACVCTLALTPELSFICAANLAEVGPPT